MDFFFFFSHYCTCQFTMPKLKHESSTKKETRRRMATHDWPLIYIMRPADQTQVIPQHSVISAYNVQITLQHYRVHVKLDELRVCPPLYFAGGSASAWSFSLFSASGAAVTLSSGHRSEIRKTWSSKKKKKKKTSTKRNQLWYFSLRMCRAEMTADLSLRSGTRGGI